MNPYNITILTLPPFMSPTVPSTPRKESRKCRTLEDCHSPAKHIHENIQQESSARPPLAPLELPLSPLKRNNYPACQTLPTPLQTPFHKSTAPSTSTLEGQKSPLEH